MVDVVTVAGFTFQNLDVEVHERSGGADGVVARPLKKTEEKPLKSGVYCHLLILPMALRNPLRFSGHPHIALFWQQLATVGCPYQKLHSFAFVPRRNL